MSSLPSTTRTIDQLCLSPLNVRINQEDANKTEAMERSLLEQGQLEPILVHPMKGNAKLWGSHAGGRRYRAFKNLIARGQLGKNHPIAVQVREGYSDADLIEESLAENMIRRDLRDYEKFAGVRRAHRHGHSAAQIAEKLGQEPKSIEQMLRLADLAEPIFAALSAGNINTDQAKAFGATADVTLQLQAWKALSMHDVVVAKPPEIRKALGVENADLGKLLSYVGEDAYIAAGGRLEPDMFAEGPDARGRIVDAPRLRQLADAKMEQLRAATRARVGRPDLRFVAEPPKTTFDTTDVQLQVTPQPTGDGDAQTIPGGDGDVVARIVIRLDGTAGVEFWWASRSAKHGSTKKATPASADRGQLQSWSTDDAGRLAPAAALGQQYDNARQVADAAIKEEEGLSADSVNIFRSLRRQILRSMLVDDAADGGEAALDYLIWTQLRQAMDMDAQPKKLGIAHSIVADADPEFAKEHVRAIPASETWRDALDQVRRRSFITEPDLQRAFGDYRAETAEMKNLAIAVVAGWSLDRSLKAEGYDVPVHDELARQLGAASLNHDEAVRHYWTPTEQLLARLPTAHALAIAEPFIEPDSFGAWAKAKAAEVTRRLTQLVTGQRVPGLRPDRAAAAASWVHPLLRFAPAAPVTDTDTAAIAAEHEAA